MADTRITFEVASDLRARVFAAAEAADLTVSQWIRAAIREKLERDAR